ncbi:threonine--tRNA ligase 1, cytoplasmic isoform X2 [Phalacrocorax aristotelis]|uniref:threonine--tRNA ligase 1, cytoplasmic isoform X2 n=1 Tax=Phalacrocorax aristotelis TaxID=126867 RepID=UPI003F4B5D9B
MPGPGERAQHRSALLLRVGTRRDGPPLPQDLLSPVLPLPRRPVPASGRPRAAEPGAPPPLTPLAGLEGTDDAVEVEVAAALVEAVHGHVEGLLLEDHMDALHGEVAAALGVAVAVEQRGPAPLVVAEEGQQHLAHLGVGGSDAGEVRVLAALGAEAGGQRPRRQHGHVPVRRQPRHRRRRVLAHGPQQQVGPSALQGHHVHQAEEGAVAARRVLVGELKGVAGRQTGAALPQAPHRVLDGRPHPPQREEVNAGEEKKADCGKKKMKEGAGDGGRTELNPWPAFISERLEMYNKLKAEHDALLAERAANDSKPIKVTLPDGKQVDAESWKTTPYQIACGISQGLADNTVIAKVNKMVWDLDRPLEEDCTLELLKFEDEEAQAVYWHSSAHIMGEAMERIYGGCLCYGPPIENGFYYDMFLEEGGVSSNDFSALETLCKKIMKEKQAFERLEVKKETLLEMFKYNKFKCRILNEKVNTPTTTVYRCGPLIDLCRGPHVRHTGKIKTIKIHKNSSTYWEGKADMESLQRIYGISFPDAKMLKEWEKFQEEAKSRDHRKIGRDQELFFFHELSPGSCFFLPKGAYIYNTLIEFIRSEYRKRGFQEVVTPNVFNSKLWMTSGHWQHYSDNMFSFEVEKEVFALKPMNCPGHCLMFDHRPRSWRELPLRLADFGVLHRNELSGALTGLTRVRRFQQDDAHIFCAMEQIEEEIKSCLHFLRTVYDVFGFSFKLYLSTRPEKYLGDIEVWNQAEKQLENSLNDFGEKWELNPGDGAFYGPKIDIQIKDAIGRYHQCATIQLDFQLPVRFNLTFVSHDGNDKTRPVIIHRAILGSVERMIAILTENYGGKWPLWLSPQQVMVVPVGPACDEYAQKVRQHFHDAGLMADVDVDPGCTLNKKIRNAQLAQYNFILVVGEKEKTSGTVNIRTRDNKVHGERTIADTVERLLQLKCSRSRQAEEEF